MNNAARILTPLRFPTTLHILLLGYGLWWAGLLALHFHPSGNGLHTLLFPASVLAVVMVTMQMSTLAAALRLLTERRAPASFVHATVRNAQVQLLVAHAFMVVSAGAHLWMPRAGLQFLTLPAILSLVSCAALLAGIVNRRYPSVLAALAIALGITAMLSMMSLSELVIAIDGLPWPVLGVVGALWPALLCAGALRPQRVAAYPLLTEPARRDRLWHWIDSRSKRTTFLPWTRGTLDSARTSFGGIASWWPGFVSIIYLGPLAVLSPSAGEPVGRWAVGAIALMVMSVSDLLPVRDLHWRGVLAPGGWRAGQIGLRLWASAFMYYGTVSVGAIGGWAVFDIAAGRPLRWQGLADVATTCIELAAIAALVVLIRGAFRSPWIAAVAMALAALLTALVDAIPIWLTLLRDSALYIPMLLAVTGICVVLANRAWTIDKLMAPARA